MSGGQDQYADCAAVTDWQSQIDTGAYIKQGTLLCLHTAAGRYASAQVVGEQYDQNLDIILSFQITVWDLTSS